MFQPRGKMNLEYFGNLIKKITDTIKKKLGKKVGRPSLSEIKTNKYREKKGLPPLKKK